MKHKKLIAGLLSLALCISPLSVLSTATAAENETAIAKDGNDSMSSADTLQLNGSLTSSFEEVEDSYDTDWYKITVPASGKLTISITQELNCYNYSFYQQTQSDLKQIGDEVTRTWNENAKFKVYTSEYYLEKGIYYICMNNRVSYYATYTGQYKIDTSYESSNVTTTEDNHSLLTAYDISDGREINDVLTETSNTEDWYKYDLKESGYLSADFTMYLENMNVSIYTPEGDELMSQSYSWNDTAKYLQDSLGNYLEKGIYYIKISSFREYNYDNTGNYKLKITTKPASVNHTENNNSMQTAFAVDFDKKYNGCLTLQEHMGDWFKFTLSKDAKVPVNLITTADRINLRVYNTSGDELYNEELSKDDSAGRGESTYYFALESGTYYMCISGFRRYSYENCGNYSVTVQKSVQLTSMLLNYSSKSVSPNDTVQLKVTKRTPANATYADIEWSSRNENVAKVDANGLVTAYNSGTAVITATALDGSNVKANCRINVKVGEVNGLYGYSASYNSVYMYWNSASGATKYFIYAAASKNGKYQKIGTTKNTYFTARKRPFNKYYFYKIVASNGSSGCNGKASTTIRLKTVLNTPSINYSSNGNNLSISVKKVAGAHGYQIQHQGPGSAYYGTIKTVSSGKSFRYTYKRMKAHGYHYFRVRAFRKCGGKKIFGEWYTFSVYRSYYY